MPNPYKNPLECHPALRDLKKKFNYLSGDRQRARDELDSLQVQISFDITRFNKGSIIRNVIEEKLEKIKILNKILTFLDKSINETINKMYEFTFLYEYTFF